MVEVTRLRFGERALRRGYITRYQLSECLALQKVLRSNGVDKLIGAVMQDKGYLTPPQIQEIIYEADGSIATPRNEDPKESQVQEFSYDRKEAPAAQPFKGNLTPPQVQEMAYEIGGSNGNASAQPIDGYLIVDTIGKGGMGAVYEAIQISLDRTVALKILPSHLSDDKNFLQRFVREAKSAGRLNHPNIVQALDVGESNGYYYFAMEYVEGGTVRDNLEIMGTYDEEEALEIVYQVALALEHAWQNNIVHRDIKPDNIMLTHDNVVKLGDLGLARFMGRGGSVTQAGMVMGTPFYLSPEQARGEEIIDTRSDIYSLGATLFHMLTGNPPYTGSSVYIIVSKHINEEFPDPRTIRPEISTDTARLLKWMTEKDIDKRCQSPDELIKTVEMMLAGEKNPFDSSVSKVRVFRKGTSRIFSAPRLPEEMEKEDGELASKADSETRIVPDRNSSVQDMAESGHAVEGIPETFIKQKENIHRDSGECVIDSDLSSILEAWDGLPDAIRQSILTLVKAAKI